MSEANRGFGHESDVLIRQLDGHLAALRSAGSGDLRLAEQVAEVLRSLVTGTTFASAADRARVRAAVHYFLLRRGGRGHRRLVRAVSEDVRVVNEIAHALGRDDLLLPAAGELIPA
jgi:hypothetical protein